MESAHAGASVIREAVGAFVDERLVQEAIDELLASGARYEKLGLLAGEYTVRKSLGDFYTRTNEYSGGPDAPNTAFVAKESVGDTVHAFIGSLYFAGSTVAAGAAVASAGILGGGLIAAAAGAAAIGAIGAVLSGIIYQSDTEELEEQIEEGHLLLFVRVRGPDHEKRTVEILRKHAPIEVKVATAPRSA